jgi:hypothetical protein
LSKVIAALLSMPFSNAPVERVFSQLRQIKDDRRTSLKDQTLVGLLQTKCAVQDMKKNMDTPHGSVAAKFQPPAEMFKLLKKMVTNAANEECRQIRADFIQNI